MKSSKGTSLFSLETIGGKVMIIVLFLIILAFFLLLLQDKVQPMIQEMAKNLMSGGFMGG